VRLLSVFLLYQGLLRSPASWARVGRGYLKAFVQLGLDVAAVAPRGFRHDPSWPWVEGVRELRAAAARLEPEADLGLGFIHPPLLGRLLGRRRVCLFVWEADRIPVAWVEPLSRQADLVAVPSEFTAAALVQGGVPHERVVVAPYGFDEDHVRGAEALASRPAHLFTFLAILSPHWRKGPRELLAAYRQAFSRGDDVLLRIQSTYDPGDSTRQQPFEIPSWRSLLRDCGLEDPGAPPVELDLRTRRDEEILTLCRQAHVVVQPSWGESFGLAILEGLAAGRPVIATGWGGHVGFFASRDDLIDHRLASVPYALYEEAPEARVAIPSVDSLAARMRWHRDHPEASRQLGAEGRERVRGMTWLAAARRLLEAAGVPRTSAGGRGE
jgi:glycosyltransferase involved in cell wall biosynthesis